MFREKIATFQPKMPPFHPRLLVIATLEGRDGGLSKGFMDGVQLWQPGRLVLLQIPGMFGTWEGTYLHLNHIGEGENTKFNMNFALHVVPH